VYDWNIAVYNGDIKPEVYKADPYKALYDAAAFKRNRTYYKTADCLKCKHYYICDGVEKQIKNITLQPEEGEKIDQVNFYRKGYYR
jgi:radical SAM protein with 4Fe4S-binding SPASM domain